MARKPEASKLFNLREWLTIDDAARHLSIVFGEEVTRADVLRLVLDKRLTLSVDFVNHARAQRGKLVPVEECQFRVLPALVKKAEIPPHLPQNAIAHADLGELASDIRDAINAGKLIILPEGIFYRGNEVLVLDDAVESISGIWDLPMVCQSALNFDPVSASNFDPFARRGLRVALVSSELAGIAETRRARVA